MARSLIWFVGCAAPLAALLYAPAQAEDARAATPATAVVAAKPVLVAPVHFGSVEGRRTFVAVIKPRVEADQGFRVAGKVARRLVDVGAEVKAGDDLAVLDDKDLRLQKEQAEAELAAATRAFQTATADEERGRALHDHGWNSNAVYDKQKSALEEARSRLRRAERAVELARNALGYAILHADSDGSVTATMIEPGQVVGAGQPAVRLARKGEKEAAVAVPETMIDAVRSGAASLTLWSRPDRAYVAKLREISPAADPVSRTFAARFSIPDADSAIALGMSATLTLKSAGVGELARVPLSAIFNQGGGAALWTVKDDGTLVLKPVTIARYENKDALISGGVAEGERIVVVGVQKLDPAVKVRPVTEITF
jgi:RND family efflux transporter MFP subunit